MLFCIFIIICQFLKLIAESRRYTLNFLLQKVQDGCVLQVSQGRPLNAVWGGQKGWSLQGVCDDINSTRNHTNLKNNAFR